MQLLKKDVSARMSKKMGCPRYQCTEAIDAMFEVITEALRDDLEINFIGFGKFYATEVNYKNMKLPTGERMDREIKVKRVRFKPSVTLKREV